MNLERYIDLASKGVETITLAFWFVVVVAFGGASMRMRHTRNHTLTALRGTGTGTAHP